MLATEVEGVDEGLMDRGDRVPTQRFREEAGGALMGIKGVVEEMMAGLGQVRAVELERLLGIDATLAWQVHRIATEGGRADSEVLGLGAAMPSRAALEKFAKMMVAKGVGKDLRAELASAYDRLDEVVERHAGDRTTFISLATAASVSTAGVTKEWLATDLQHRRYMFRGMSHAMGVQAETRVVCQILGNEPVASEAFRFAFLSGYGNVRTLREVERVRLYGSMIVTTAEKAETKLVERKPLKMRGEHGMLADFCSAEVPELVYSTGVHDRHQWAELALVRPEVGKLGATTVMFGEEFVSPILPDSLRQRTNLPVETLVMDLLAPAGRIVKPEVDVYLGETQPLLHAPDRMPLLGEHRVEGLGRGVKAARMKELPRYGEMLEAVGEAMGWWLESYEVWRLRMDYPIYHGTVRWQWATQG